MVCHGFDLYYYNSKKYGEIENYHLERGYVLGSCNIEEKGLVVYLPIYMISRFLNE